MRQYRYEVGNGADIHSEPGRAAYTVLCRSWDDVDQDADAWVRVVNWYHDRAVAERDCAAFQANSDEAMKQQWREDAAALADLKRCAKA